MKETIQLRDFLEYKFLSNLQASTNEENIAFVASVCNEEENTYDRCLQIYDGKVCRTLTTYGKESMYLWEDDEHILFAGMREDKDKEAVKNGEEKTCFYRISIHGGEALKAFTIPLTVTSIKKFDTDRYIICADYHLLYSYAYALEGEQKAKAIKEKRDMDDYEVLDEVPFYGNGAGFTNKTRNTLFLYDAANDDLTRISEELFNVSDYEVDTEKGIVYYVGEAYAQRPRFKEAVMAYHISTQGQEVLLKSEIYSISKVLPWGKDILVVASEQMHYGMNENPRFYKLNPESKQMALFCDYEDAIGSSVGSDCRYGGGRFIKCYRDEVYFLTTLFNRSVICKLTNEGTIQEVYDAEGSVDDFDFAKGNLYFCGMQDMKLQELYLYELQGKRRHQISTYNEALLQKKDVRPCIPVQIEQEGMTLYGWVLEPKNYDPKKSYPAILDIHGGPKTVYGEVFYHEMQLWANMGYFVFFMNPRGGDGRGNEFADLRGKYGTIDYEDIMKFTDVVLEKYPAIDSKRVGVTGGSYGGFMTNWIIGHTDRFAAAASQRSIANWISFVNTSDIGDIFGSDQQGGNIWDDHDKLWWHSPLKYARNCTTPTLFIHSDEDYRCPLSEGYQMYSALCNLGIETRLCLFHGENHELSRSGKPRHRVKRLEEITNWMETHLK